MGSISARTGTGTHAGWQYFRQWLYLLCHSPQNKKYLTWTKTLSVSGQSLPIVISPILHLNIKIALFIKLTCCSLTVIHEQVPGGGCRFQPSISLLQVERHNVFTFTSDSDRLEQGRISNTFNFPSSYFSGSLISVYAKFWKIILFPQQVLVLSSSDQTTDEITVKSALDHCGFVDNSAVGSRLFTNC